MNRSDAVNEAYAEWISTRNWAYWGVLTLAEDVSRRRAMKKFGAWFEAAEKKFGQLESVSVVERGGDTNRAHIHFVLCGLETSDVVRKKLKRMWARIGGGARITEFDKTKREEGIKYILKTVRTGDTDYIDVRFQKEKESEGGVKESEITDRAGSGRISQAKSGNGISPHLSETGTRRAAEQSMREISSGRSRENGRRKDNERTVNIPARRIQRDSGFHVERFEDFLIVILPLEEPHPSKSSGRTNIIASTRGPRATFAELDGLPILVNAMAMVNPTRPLWKQRAQAQLANKEGRLS